MTLQNFLYLVSRTLTHVVRWHNMKDSSVPCFSLLHIPLRPHTSFQADLVKLRRRTHWTPPSLSLSWGDFYYVSLVLSPEYGKLHKREVLVGLYLLVSVFPTSFLSPAESCLARRYLEDEQALERLRRNLLLSGTWRPFWLVLAASMHLKRRKETSRMMTTATVQCVSNGHKLPVTLSHLPYVL